MPTVKPYIPYDIVPSEYILPMATTADGIKLPIRPLQVPEWVVESDIPMKPVLFSPSAEVDIQSLFSRGRSQRQRRISQTQEEATELIKQVLRQDIRSTHQGRGNVDNIVISDNLKTNSSEGQNIATVVEDFSKPANHYSCVLDGMSLSFRHLIDGILIDSIKEVNRS